MARKPTLAGVAKPREAGPFAQVMSQQHESPVEPSDVTEGSASNGQSTVTSPSPKTPRVAASKRAQEEKPKKKKEGFYMDPEELQYADLVYMSTQVQTGIRSKTAFYEEAIRFFVKHLEEDFNNGKQFKNPFAK